MLLWRPFKSRLKTLGKHKFTMSKIQVAFHRRRLLRFPKIKCHSLVQVLEASHLIWLMFKSLFLGKTSFQDWSTYCLKKELSAVSIQILQTPRSHSKNSHKLSRHKKWLFQIKTLKSLVWSKYLKDSNSPIKYHKAFR